MNDPAYTLLLCNGEMAAPEVVRHLASHAQAVVCADGGANAAAELDILPDTVVGDFDSMTAATRARFTDAGAEMLHITRQDDTDFEKALKILRERGVRRLVVLGLTGKLLDHTLGNFSILLRYAREFSVILFDPNFRVDVLTAPAALRSDPGDRVSIVPLAPTDHLSYEGLRYPLTDAALAFGMAEGTCNEATGKRFTLTFSRGVLLVFRSLHPDLYRQLLET